MITYRTRYDTSYLEDGPNYFNFQQYEGSCCGMVELCLFDFQGRFNPKEFAEAFHQALRGMGEVKRKGIAHLTLTKTKVMVGDDLVDEEYHQPEWFREAMKLVPTVHAGPWVMNPNSGNYLQMYTFILNDNTHADA